MYEEAPEIIRSFLSYKLNIQNRSPLTVSEYWLDLRAFFRFIILSRGDTEEKDFEKVDVSAVDLAYVESEVSFVCH